MRCTPTTCMPAGCAAMASAVPPKSSCRWPGTGYGSTTAASPRRAGWSGSCSNQHAVARARTSSCPAAPACSTTTATAHAPASACIFPRLMPATPGSWPPSTSAAAGHRAGRCVPCCGRCWPTSAARTRQSWPRSRTTWTAFPAAARHACTAMCCARCWRTGGCTGAHPIRPRP
jgi:hypothetical protein